MDFHIGTVEHNPQQKFQRARLKLEKLRFQKKQMQAEKLEDLINEVNSGVPQPDFVSIAEQNRNKQANFIYSRYLKDPDNSVECKL